METTITATIETITPAMAIEYLKRNIGQNRTLRTKVIGKYARDMKSGNFATTHQGIAFDTEGNLIDGQHRLTSIIISGTPIVTLVTRNVPKDAMMYIDRGTSRSVHDSLVVSNPGASVVSRTLKHSAVPAVIRQMVVCSYKNMSLSVSETTKIFDVFKNQMVELFSLNNAKHNGANRAQVLSAAVAAMYCGVSVDVIDKFFLVFKKANVTDCNGYNVNAALDWRRQIDEAKYRGARMEPMKIYLGTQNAIYHFVNNTDVKHIVVPKEQRYNVTEVVKSAIVSM